jgi:hypothetical protein
MEVCRHGTLAWQTNVTSPVKPQPSGWGDPIKTGMYTVANQCIQLKMSLLYVHYHN